MKTIIALILCVSAIAAETNRPPATNAVVLNAHERFYVNYRANKARFERGIAELKAVKQKEETLAMKRWAAGLPSVPNSTTQYGERIDLLTREIAKLDVARLEYEKKFPDAARFANSPPVTIPITPPRAQPQRVIIQRDPSERYINEWQQSGALIRSPPPPR